MAPSITHKASCIVPLSTTSRAAARLRKLSEMDPASVKEPLAVIKKLWLKANAPKEGDFDVQSLFQQLILPSNGDSSLLSTVRACFSASGP